MGLRPKLDKLMREVDKHSCGSLDFQDFVRMYRQFQDLQTQEKNDKERRVVEETGFTTQEVQDFRGLFLASGRDKELSLADVKRLVGKICPMSEKMTADLIAVWHEVRNPPNAPPK